MSKTILITGAGSGFGEAAAIGMARNGHDVIATVQIFAAGHAAARGGEGAGLAQSARREAGPARLATTSPMRRPGISTCSGTTRASARAGRWSRFPIDLVRRNYEVNVFKPLELTQGFISKWVATKKRDAKIVFTSSMGGLFTPAYWGVYVSTKHALESVAEAMQLELTPYGIKVQTINPGAF